MQTLHELIFSRNGAKLSLVLIVLLSCPSITLFTEFSAAADTISTKETPLSLSETIDIAIKNNIGLQNVYRDRIVQKFDLKVSEDKFVPKPVLTLSTRNDSTSANGNENSTLSGVAALTIAETIPTGGQINVSLAEASSKPDNSSSATTGSWGVTVAQPLLKGGGIDVNTASVRAARINEKINLIALKSSVMDLISSVITSYRTFLQSREQLEITKQSLERAKELVMINRELIDAGRMAEVEIIQTEADVANREFSVLAAENSADAARLALIKLLDIDKKTLILPTEKVVLTPANLDLDEIRKVAFTNRPDLLSALLHLEVSRMNLMVAENNKLWDLSLTGSYNGSYTTQSGAADSRTSGWNLGLQLSIPFRDLTLEQGYLSARIALEKDEANLAKLRENIEIEVQDQLRDTEMKLRQVKLAQLARTLTEKKLEIEREKLKSGRSTNFQLVSYENDLVNAQSSELGAIIGYQNSLAALDRAIGTTLDRWGIALNEGQGAEP